MVEATPSGIKVTSAQVFPDMNATLLEVR